MSQAGTTGEACVECGQEPRLIYLDEVWERIDGASGWVKGETNPAAAMGLFNVEVHVSWDGQCAILETDARALVEELEYARARQDWLK